MNVKLTAQSQPHEDCKAFSAGTWATLMDTYNFTHLNSSWITKWVQLQGSVGHGDSWALKESLLALRF